MKPILIIEDEEAIRSILCKSLERYGYRIDSAASGVEARARFAQEQPGLVLSDLQLDDADGLELISDFKRRAPGLPCILLTGVLFDPAVVRGDLLRNVACYLEKTQPLQRVVSEVRRLYET